MAGGLNTIGNLLGKVDANGALLVALDGTSPATASRFFADASATLPGFSITGDTNTGYGASAADTAAIWAGGTTPVVTVTASVAASLVPWTMPAGTGSGTYVTSGVLTASTTQVGTGADTNETDLWTYSLPANTLSANGKGVRVTVFGSCASNTNAKTIKTYFGSTVVVSNATSNASTVIWQAEAVILRTGASAQLSEGWTLAGGTNSLNNNGLALTTPAETTTGAIVIKVTGQNGTAVANDIVFRGAVVEYMG